MYFGDQKCVQNVSQYTKERDNLEARVDESIILKQILNT
jgi:hypothetical protein